MQKDIWQPGSIVLHAVLVIKCILPENTHLLPCLPRGQHCSLPDLAKGKMKKRKKNVKSATFQVEVRGTYLGRQEHDLYFLN